MKLEDIRETVANIADDITEIRKGFIDLEHHLDEIVYRIDEELNDEEVK